MTPIWGDRQIARALILSHVGKKPLARYRAPSVTVCVMGAVAPDNAVGPVSAAIPCPATKRPHAPMPLRCDALGLVHCPLRPIRTIQGFLSTQGSGPVMIAVLQTERSSLRWLLWARERNVTKRKAAAATRRSCRVGAVGGLDRRLGDAGPVGQPFVCRSSLSRRGGRQHPYV